MSTTDNEARMLRDKVYGRAISDNEWEKCKAIWTHPEQVAWLREQAALMKPENETNPTRLRL